jgi:hypothetical protein
MSFLRPITNGFLFLSDQQTPKNQDKDDTMLAYREKAMRRSSILLDKNIAMRSLSKPNHDVFDQQPTLESNANCTFLFLIVVVFKIFKNFFKTFYF